MKFGNLGCFVHDISEDKQHIIYSGNFDYIIKDMVNGTDKVIEFGEPWTSRQPETSIYFINNSLIYIKGKVFNLEGNQIVEFKYYDDNSLISSFSKVENSDFILDSNGNLYLTSGENKALQELKLLFTPTTGRCNDTRVRMREYPLLEAEHLAFLNNGDELEILDRSGIEVEIGDMKDYWYKVRRISDGLEGWSYGAFIDVDESPEPDRGD